MNMLIYLIGTLLVVAALAYGASTLGVDAVWIGVGAAIILGFGIMSAVSRTQRKE
jgi:Zn-dependent protease with chaperone function